MPSVYVTWFGNCDDGGQRRQIRNRIDSLAAVASGLIEQRPLRQYDCHLDGVVVADRALFPTASFERISEDFVRVSSAYLSGNEFRLTDPRGLYPGMDRVSFVFASVLGDREALQDPSDVRAVSVLVEDAAQCKLYEDSAIRTADFYLRTPTVHLRDFAERWMNSFLAFIRHFHMPGLWYWNKDDLPGVGQYEGIDRTNLAAREIAWRAIQVGLLNELVRWLPRELEADLGPEFPAMREHLKRNGEIPKSWWTTPFERIPIQVKIADDLSGEERSDIARCLMFAHAEFETSARQAIREARKGLNLWHVPLRFNGCDLSLRSHFDATDQTLHAQVRWMSLTFPNEAVAENEQT